MNVSILRAVLVFGEVFLPQPELQVDTRPKLLRHENFKKRLC